MCGTGSFFSMPSKEARDYLVSIRRGITQDEMPVEYTVLLLALRGASSKKLGRTTATSNQSFLDECQTAFTTTEARCHSLQQPQHASSIACAWYPKGDLKALFAAISIHQSIVASSATRPIYISIGIDEYAAFRMLRLAGEGQIVVDPNMWPGLEIHAPQTEQLHAFNQDIRRLLEERLRPVGKTTSSVGNRRSGRTSTVGAS